MEFDGLKAMLLEALPILAKITCGYAALTDNMGKRIKTVDSLGNELIDLRGVVYDLAKEAANKKKTVSGLSQLEYKVETWCMPIDDYVICCSNVEIVKKNYELKQGLLDALPFIARVAGGEAVIFDNEGRRIAAVNSCGNSNVEYLGAVSPYAKEAMDMQKPVIGESNSITGSKAVRIPITREFGFGFNNEDNTLKSHKLIDEVKKYQSAKYNFADIVGESAQMNRMKEIANIAAQSNSNVLLFGETGTGKELFAQAIHNGSERYNKPFVAMNCAAIPANLIESSFFGYETGAFTGAKKGGTPGIFEQANGGTVFLDEISEMELQLQSKLLRVLQEREVTRIGGSKVIPLDIRVISATNKSLDEMIKENKFRRDLFYRINVIDIELIPLRQMKSDIYLIVQNIMNRMNREFGKFITDIEEEALEVLLNYNWPGNVRELSNCIEKVFNVIGNDKYIKKEHLPFRLINGFQRQDNVNQSLDEMLQGYEKTLIEKVLLKNNGVKSKTAKDLKISTTTLWRRIKDLGIESK